MGGVMGRGGQLHREKGGFAVLALAVLLAGAPRPVNAGLTGSRHDWVTGPAVSALPAEGACSACHVPHYAAGAKLWTRSLAQEAAYYRQSAAPNYLPGSTGLCFDCHDDGASADTDPPRAIWSADHLPQDIALGGAGAGYYELIDGTAPAPGTAPVDGSPTGGHYWKSVPSGSPAVAQGDKLACEICHDPHRVATGTNDAFFRTETADGNGGAVILGDALKASPASHDESPGGTGREMCAACHRYSEPTSGAPVTLWSIQVPRPPASIAQHSENDAQATPCTICHPHNRVMPTGPASCTSCHGANCTVHPGVDGVPNTADDAPNVMTTGCASPPGISVWDGTWWDTQRGGGDATQQGGHGDPDGFEGGNANAVPTCDDCHDTSLPPSTHLDGVYNSLGTENPMPWMGGAPRPKANPNANTAHLEAAYFAGAGEGGYSWQVAVDGRCYLACHQAIPALKVNNDNGMRHEQDTIDSDPNHHSVELGTHLTVATTPAVIMDSDLTTNAGGTVRYSPCVSCHNPHGTTNTDAKEGASAAAKNHMIVGDYKWATAPPRLCDLCHQ